MSQKPVNHELKRKSIHFAGLVVPVTYYLFPEDRKGLAIMIMCAIALVYFTSELMRFVYPPINRLIIMRFSALLRKDEHQKVTGSGYYLIGALVSMILFPKTIAIVSMMFLIVGDFFAAVVGIKWGRIRLIGRKSLEGSLACLVSCLVVSSIFLPFPIALAGSISATLAELIPMKVNDNLLVPVLSGLVMFLVSKVQL